MLKYRGGHAQVFFGAALLTDITSDPEDAFERIVLIPHQYQTQFDGDLAPVGPQAIEQEQLSVELGAQGGQLFGLVQRATDLFDQAVHTGQLLRVGNG